MSWVHYTMVVPNAYVTLARSLAAALAGEAGSGMWTTGLSSSGEGTPTHWISAGLILPEFAALLEDAAQVFEACQGEVPLETIEAMLAGSTVRGDANPHEVISELGLKIINDAESVL